MGLNRELKYVKKMWRRASEKSDYQPGESHGSQLDMTQNTEVMIKLVNLEKENEE